MIDATETYQAKQSPQGEAYYRTESSSLDGQDHVVYDVKHAFPAEQTDGRALMTNKNVRFCVNPTHTLQNEPTMIHTPQQVDTEKQSQLGQALKKSVKDALEKAADDTGDIVEAPLNSGVANHYLVVTAEKASEIQRVREFEYATVDQLIDLHTHIRTLWEADLLNPELAEDSIAQITSEMIGPDYTNSLPKRPVTPRLQARG